MERYPYVIVGGGLAAGRAVEGIRRNDKAGPILMVCAEQRPPYHRPNLSKGYLRGQDSLAKVLFKEPGFYPENNVDLWLGTAVTAIDPAAKTVTVADGRVVGYEKLLLATGSTAIRLPIPGADLPGVLTLRSIEDSDAIRQAAQPGAHALVLGGSFMGSEVAASLSQLGVSVTLVFMEDRLMQAVVPPAFSALLHERFRSLAQGARLIPGASITRLEERGGKLHASLSTNELVTADLVVMGVGARPNTSLAAAAGLEMTARGGIVVDEFLRTSATDVYAAGDIAAWPEPSLGRQMRVEHWDVARNQGFRAGRNMSGTPRPYDTLPYFFTDVFDVSPEVWGDPSGKDVTVLRGSLEQGHYAFYYFRDGKVTAVLAAGRPDAEREPMQAIVRARLPYDAVAAHLMDEAYDIGALAEIKG